MKSALCALAILLFCGMETAFAGTCPPGPPTSRGDGTVAGVAVTGGTQYYFKDALLANFDCFEQLSSWFPSYFTSSNSISPNHQVVDMAYAAQATATWFNVVVPTTGNYTLTVRYAYASGLFPGVTDRPEGISVNGVVVTNDMHFPITGNFETFENSSITVPLNAGKNTVQMFNIAAASISRADALTITAAGSTSCGGVPGAPGTLSAAAASSTQINLSWTASAAPAGCTVGSYSVFRSTTSGFTPSSSNQIMSGVTATAFDDTTVLCNTAYHYVVEAVDSDGASPPSAQANATTGACPTTSSVQINSGGGAVAPFVADKDFSGGGTINHANTINLTGVTNPAPMAVYQTARTGNFSYTISGFSPGSSHMVRLHFAETFFSTTGSRTFNVSINGTTVLTNFDIVAAAGGMNKAVIEQFTEAASSTGNYVITFSAVVNQSLVSGIEIQ
ncbi:MAG TPA: malectin domain-containing carbohydrate-binding protein [Candidatus Angelobacter sp.]|nr:malectin domain-containing carbohydrate-binding protein [Candidatus Angelobacter sp.]